jgi:hypothetical protein
MPYQLVKVTPYAGAKYDYAFRTPNFDASLGHEQVSLTVAPTKPIVIGCNNSKPLRARKKLATGYKSSYVSVSSVDAATTAGYSIGRVRSKKYNGGARSKAVCVKVNANLYLGWNMRLTTYNKLGAAGRTAAGIVDASTVPADELAFGCQSVILPTVVLGVPAGQIISIKDFESGIEVAGSTAPVKTKKAAA